jgi:predicted metal-dependent HD superfamily phosphohydrolase
MPDASSSNTDGAIAHALARLAAELSPELTYHNLGHTQADVIPGVARLARLSQVTEEDMPLLEVAAAYHDIGFIHMRVEHERASVRIAAETLPAYGFSPQQIERIAGMILATRLPQSPHNRLEEILADADLDVLGRDDFFERNEQLRLEFNTVSPPLSVRAWWTAQIRFLQGHTYFTPAARALRQAAKERHIVLLEQWLRAAGDAPAPTIHPTGF